jgi:hypothetical protein
MGNNSHVVVSHKICGCQGLVAAALSWWRSQLWFRQSSSFFRGTFYLKRFKTSQ